MEIDKQAIKQDLINKSNDILKNYKEPYVVEDIAILNTNDNINFLGNMRVMVEESVRKIKSDLKNALKDYENVTIRDSKVVPCCEPPFIHISFNVTINKQ
ncbi:MAG: hypothetical protein HUK28_04075 [Methanobrevibacter sp.]|nr:hypothetical protein [Methanobrevibacter sp.]